VNGRLWHPEALPASSLAGDSPSDAASALCPISKTNDSRGVTIDNRDETYRSFAPASLLRSSHADWAWTIRVRNSPCFVKSFPSRARPRRRLLDFSITIYSFPRVSTERHPPFRGFDYRGRMSNEMTGTHLVGYTIRAFYGTALSPSESPSKLSVCEL